ncbi:MAG: hypothetical protein L6R40_003231 [Gallowayella cf. fulva]|nr:MAG: hypothetical protein L6R40_003231 [Xanthomendoza cf. fulva]
MALAVLVRKSGGMGGRISSMPRCPSNLFNHGLPSIHIAFKRLLRPDSQDIISQQSSSEVDNGTPKFTRSTTIAAFDHQCPTSDLSSPLHDHHQAPFKRALSEQFHCLIDKGQQYLETGVLPAFNGQSRFPTPNVGAAEDPLADSGWTSTADSKPLPKWWKDAFKAIPGKTPKDNVLQIYLDQELEFSNDYGEQVSPAAHIFNPPFSSSHIKTNH